GDDYFGCYAQLADRFSKFGSGGVPQGAPIALGPELDTFALTLPDDIVSRRPLSSTTRYGIAYVFFASSAANIKPVAAEGTSAAQSFPIGCFDSDTKQRLGPESFVAGYTQVYSFEDGRTNANPTTIGLTLDDNPIDEKAPPSVKVCSLSDDARREQ